MTGRKLTPCLTGAEEVIRDRLAIRREKLNALCPEALDLDAIFRTSLSRSLYGKTPKLRGDRPARFRRGQFEGEKGFDTADLFYLLIHAPDETEAALAAVMALRGVLVTRERLGPQERREMADSLERVRNELEDVESRLVGMARREYLREVVVGGKAPIYHDKAEGGVA